MDYLQEIQDTLAQIEQLAIDPTEVQNNIDEIESLYQYIIEVFKQWVASGGSNQVDTIDGIISILTDHISNINNPHIVTAAQVGLGNVQNLAPEDMPVSTAVQDALDAKSYDMDAHISNMSNPHNVTGYQVGFDIVPGPTGGFDVLQYTTSGPTGTIFGTFNAVSIEQITSDESDFVQHLGNTGNPHMVTADQVGLGNVDNTADIDKPVSTATQAAINNAVGPVGDDLTAHMNDFNNPHNVTLSQLGLTGYPDDPNDMPVPDLVQQLISALQTSLNNHLNNFSNPHQTTAALVGLGNVDNTSDVDKPLSTAAQAANTNLQNQINTNATNISNNTTSITANTNNIAVNTADIVTLKYELSQMGLGTLGFGGIYADTGSVTSPQDGVLYLIGTSPNFSLQIYYNSTWTVVMAQAEIDLSGFVTEESFENAISTINTQLQGIQTNTNSITTLNTNLTNHINNLTNPHAVTASQIGLGNVQNLAPADLPISNATQTALNNITATLPTLTFDASAINSGRFTFDRFPLMPGQTVVGNSSTGVAQPVSIGFVELITTTFPLINTNALANIRTTLDVQNTAFVQNASNLTSGTIPNARIGTGAISSANIANLAVTNAAIADLAVTNAKIANNTIALGKMANQNPGVIGRTATGSGALSLITFANLATAIGPNIPAPTTTTTNLAQFTIGSLFSANLTVTGILRRNGNVCSLQLTFAGGTLASITPVGNSVSTTLPIAWNNALTVASMPSMSTNLYSFFGATAANLGRPNIQIFITSGSILIGAAVTGTVNGNLSITGASEVFTWVI